MNAVVAEMSSAQWIWAIAVCLAFLLMVFRRDLSNQEALQIITFVVGFLFGSQRRSV